MASQFDQWCLLEIMGHQRFAGRCTEETIAGSAFLRIDVPACDTLPQFTKFFGPASVYSITPISEEIAIALQQSLRKEPVSVYDLPEEFRQRIRAPALPYRRDEEEDDDDLLLGDPDED